MSRKQFFITFLIFLLAAAGIALFAFWPFSVKKAPEQHATRLIVPDVRKDGNGDSLWYNNAGSEDPNALKAPLAEGEFVISVLNIDFDFDSFEEQVVALRSTADTGSRVSIALFAFDARNGTYRRLWSLPVLATMPGTVSLYSQDLLGDRSACIVVTGMNEHGNHTMTVFHKDPEKDSSVPFTAIAEIEMDGSIAVQETERPLAYRQGISKGQPYTVASYGRDYDSDNMMDRIEIIYAYNPNEGIYRRDKISRIPGSQIEQRRLKEILSGEAKVFEEFLNDLWYYASAQGTIDKSQYLYFDPVKREVIFFGDEAQQVFAWQNSHSSRYGLYISSYNTSVTTMRRFLDIEMETLDSIRIRVVDDTRLKVRVTAPWDGTYRRAGNSAMMASAGEAIIPYIDSAYDSSLGRIRFYPSGEYEQNSQEGDSRSSSSAVKGRYVFFRVGGSDLLELRPGSGGGETRQIFHIANTGGFGKENPADNIILTRVRLGSSGIQELHDGHIIFTRVR